MKKVSCIVCFILCVLLVIPVNAAEENKPLTDLLTESQNAGGLVPGIELSRLPDELPSVDGLPILVCIRGMNWNRLATLSFEDAVAQAFEDSGAQYVVLDPPLRRICSYAAFEPYQIETIGPTAPTYITDIVEGKQKQTFLGAEYTVENVICFDGSGNHHDHTAVFYLTDGGTFVRVYNRTDTTAVEFTLEDFQEKAHNYYSFITSYEYLYNEDGKERNAAGAGFFLDYTVNPERYHQRYRHRSITERFPYLIPAVGGLAVMIIVPVSCLIVFRIRKKKAVAGSKQENELYEDNIEQP